MTSDSSTAASKHETEVEPDRTQRHEYTTVPVGNIRTDLHTVLNEMAKSGWELVETTILNGSTEDAVFQRPVEEVSDDD